MSGGRARVYPPDADALNAVLTASRSLIAVATRSLGAAAGRMCDRLVRKGLIRRHRARADRRAVLVSVTAAGLLVVDQATVRRRALIEEILAALPGDAQQGVAEALRTFADAAGEVPDSQWPPAGSAEEVAPPRVHSRPIGVAQTGRP
jgi:DNA-binding MarR family transcriptional regulator